MLILNFTHPLTQAQRQQIELLLDAPIEEERTIAVQIRQEEQLEGQVVDAVGLTGEEWQTRELLVNPPSYAPVAFALLAELHGRMGHFPALLRIRPSHGAMTMYEVAEILNLQTIRDQARMRR